MTEVDSGILSSYAIQWYPGHIAKLEKQLKQLLQPVDVVLEVLDARAPMATRHPYLETDFLTHKQYGILLNKTDVADAAQTSVWQRHFARQGVSVMPFSTLIGNPKAVVDYALTLGESIRLKNQQKGLKLTKPLKLAILGMPNVGKSSLINKLVGKTKVKTGHQAGVTREPKWIQIHKSLILLDTPGLIPPKLRNQEQGLHLGCLHGVGEDAFDNETVAQFLINTVNRHYPDALAARYGGAVTDIAIFAQLKGLFLPGQEPDINRASLRLLTDFRHGRLGRFTLEWLNDVVE